MIHKKKPNVRFFTSILDHFEEKRENLCIPWTDWITYNACSRRIQFKDAVLPSSTFLPPLLL